MNQLKKRSYVFFHLFGLLGIFFIPFNFSGLPFENRLGEMLFGGLIDWLNRAVNSSQVVYPISSDSIGLYLLVLILFFISIVFSLIIMKSKIEAINSFLTIVRRIMILFLALILFKYGCDKIFGGQFYVPEPNILYTRFGELDKDILYWSTVGVSPQYSFFLGLTEVLIALGILIRKTRIFFLLLAALMLTYIVGINFSFDISVKVFSLFLLFISLVLLIPYLSKMIHFFSGRETSPLQTEYLIPRNYSTRIKFFLIILISIIVISEGIYPYTLVSKESLNSSAHTPLNGAYSVQNNSDSTENNKKIERVYFHKNNYLIFHFSDEEMIDFYYQRTENPEELILIDYDLNQFKVSFKKEGNQARLNLNGLFGYKLLELNSLDYKSFPVLQNSFHWTVEGVK